MSVTLGEFLAYHSEKEVWRMVGDKDGFMHLYYYDDPKPKYRIRRLWVDNTRERLLGEYRNLHLLTRARYRRWKHDNQARTMEV